MDIYTVVFKLMKPFHTPHTLSHLKPGQPSEKGLVLTPMQRRKLRLSGLIPPQITGELEVEILNFAPPFSLQIQRGVFS